MKIPKQLRSSSGQMLVEILITIGLFAIIAPALATGLVESSQGSVSQETHAHATALMRETSEAVRIVRENGWTSFAINGEFHPVLTNGVWQLVTGSDNIGEFTRTVRISDVRRNNAGEIDELGSFVDPSTKLVEIELTWLQPRAGSLISSEYITRYLDNLTFTETTEEEFQLGTLENISIANNEGGEVVLGAGGNGDWCNPGQHIIPPGLDLNQNGKARDVKAVEGKAFTGTDVGASSKFVEIGISNDLPPVFTKEGEVGGYDTNDVFVDPDYGYVATKDSTKDVVIIDLNTMTEIGYLNDGSSPSEALGIWVSSDIAYVSSRNNLYTFDITDKSGPHAPISSITLPSNGNRLQIVGNYAYVTTNSTTAQLQIVDVTNPASMSLLGTANLPGGEGRRIFVNETGTRAYVATAVSSSQPELFIVDTTTKTGNLPIIGSYESNGMDPTGIAAVPGNRVILVGINGEEYQVINTTDESAPQQCGGMHFNAGIYGVAAVLEADGDAFTYIVTKDSTKEFKAFLGGSGGSGTQYRSTGIFESAAFDAGMSTAFNRTQATMVIPNQTELNYQVALAQDVQGSCENANYSFVGPDGTADTYYGADGGPVPFGINGDYTNPGRCFKYRVYLSTQDSAFTPILYDISVNYSP